MYMKTIKNVFVLVLGDKKILSITLLAAAGIFCVCRVISAVVGATSSESFLVADSFKAAS